MFAPLIWIKIPLQVIGLFFILYSNLGQAKDEHFVPPQLETWHQWVNHDLDHLECAQREGSHQCVWPSKLELTLGDRSAVFKYRISMGQEGLAPILDDERLSIQELSLVGEGDKKEPQIVVWRSRRAWVHLPKGEHLLLMTVRWNDELDTIKIPKNLALVNLRDQSGKRTWIERDQEGAVWIKARKQVSGLTSHADLSGDQNSSTHIFRVWRDEIPLKLETHIQLNISGKPRELTLGSLLPAGALITHLDSPFEADWVQEGLRVYVKPGKSTIKLNAVFPESPTEIKVPQVQGAQVAANEVWVWHRQELLRSARLSGLNEVDPDFTALPKELKGGAYTWLATPGDTLTIEELKRGVHRRPSNSLSLDRTLWLDLDGRGFTARDELNGQLKASSRLNVKTRGALGRATLKSQGQSLPLLITKDVHHDKSVEAGEEGVEIRVEELNLKADFRYPDAQERIIALDWSEPMNKLTVKINLPPGWGLFSVQGGVSDSDWLTSWAMVDIFLLALVAIGVFKLFGLAWSILALVCLILYHKDASLYLEWLSVLVTYFLLSMALKHRLFIKITGMAFFVMCLYFSVFVLTLCKTDIRRAIHPQIPSEALFSHRTSSMDLSISEEEESDYSYIQRKSTPMYRQSKKGGYSKQKEQSNYGEVDLSRQLQLLDQNAVVQTGSGIPSWQWESHYVNFEAPIEPGRELKLGLMSPMWSRSFLALRAIALLTYLFFFLSCLKSLPWTKNPSEHGGGPTQKKSQVTQNAMLLVMLSVVSTLFLMTKLAAAEEVPPGEVPQENVNVQTQTQTQMEFNIQQSSHTENMMTRAGMIHPSDQRLISSDHGALVTSFPTDELLKQWRQRLLEEDRCEGECIYIGDLKLVIKELQISVEVQVHAERASFFILPGSIGDVSWEKIQSAGKDLPLRAERSHNADKSFITVRVPQGISSVVAKGDLQDIESFELAFKDLPKRLITDLEGWQLETQRLGKVTPVLTLTRDRRVDLKKSSASRELGSRVNVDDSWFEVSRSLNLGPTWQMITQVTRIQSEEPQELKLPLIAGERVLSSEHEVIEQEVRLSFAEGQNTVGYLSELSQVAELELKAPRGVRWSEKWTLNCGVIWSCEAKGLNPISLGGGSQASLSWRPWPGESVNLSVTRPQGVKGAEVTMKKGKYRFEPSGQLAAGQVDLTLVASRGTTRTLTLPKEATHVNLTIDHEEQFDPMKDGLVRLAIKPGLHHYKVSWKMPSVRTFAQHIPPIKIDIESVNFEQEYILGHRWLIAVSGPEWGPAILFWGKLILALLLSIALSIGSWSPLSRLDWFLLMAGLTQHHASSWLLVFIWFGAFALRRRIASQLLKSTFLFNLVQFALASGTIVFLSVMYFITKSNLLSLADMQVTGAGSSMFMLKWYVDRFANGESSPQVAVYSLPLWFWSAMMLVWALWFASRLYRWLIWAWECINAGGGWRSFFGDDDISNIDVDLNEVDHKPSSQER